jgi:anaerobic magnesium-protoporphyrin IX monomethyl ester cyclase
LRILLVNPPDPNKVVENPDEQGDEFLEANAFGDFPPLGALYVISFLEEHTTGHELFFKDCIGEGMSHGKLEEYIKEVKPDVVGITSFTISLMDVCLTARKVKELFPNCHVCLGGHHPIAFPFEAAQLEEFDSIVVGEGEVAFTELVNCLEKNEGFTHIKGIFTKESIKVFEGNPVRDKRFLKRVTVPAAYVDDIDSIPMVNRKYIKDVPYQSILGVTKNLATILSSRGCPYLCTFCDVPIKSYRQRSHYSVVDEIEACLAMGYTEFHFYDDLFNITAEKIVGFCDELDRRNLKVVWDFRGRVNAITKESLIRAKASGLRMISFGVETGTDEGLKILKKATTTAKIKQTFEWCRELGILSVADYIIGQPFEKNIDDINKNIDFLIGLDPDYGQISILKLYPNTKMYDDAVAKGIVPAGQWEDFSLNPTKDFMVGHWDEFMDLQTLIKQQKKAYRRFYFRYNYITRSALKTRTWVEFLSKYNGAIKLIWTARQSVKTNIRRA